jgi:hypothetical protein
MSFGDRFFRNPDLFPARLAGEPWGERTLALDLAGGPYVFRGLGAEQEALARGHFSGFCLPAGAPVAGAVDCHAMRVVDDEFSTFDVRGWEFTLDLDPTPDSVRIAGLGLMARLEWRPALRAAFWTAATGAGFAGAIENVLRAIVSYRLLEVGGALLHSAGIVAEDGAWLFLGRSGAGKSTLARLSLDEGRSVLSDDLNAVVLEGNRCIVAPVPFAGDHRGLGTERPRLTAICKLRQGSATRLDPLSPAEGLATMLAAAPFVNQDRHRLEPLLRNLEALLAGCRRHTATIALGAPVWDRLAPEAVVA